MGGNATGYAMQRLTCSPSSIPLGTTVRVVLADMGMNRMMGGVAPIGSRMHLSAAPSQVSAGDVTFVAENRGWRTHELLILPLAPGRSAGGRTAGPDGRVSEAGSVGEASASCRPGPGTGIESGSVGWFTVRLKPGRYELLCNLPNHYADGMSGDITVTVS